METLGLWVYGSFLVVFVLEAIGGLHSLSRKTFGQVGYALTYLAFQTLFAVPVMGGLIAIGLRTAFPQSAGAWGDVPFWWVFPLWFIAEEFCHYWVHRKAHEWPWLWNLHRTHHSSRELNVSAIFRQNVFWSFFLPQTWFTATALYLGMFEVAFACVLITSTVNLLTHTAYRWDLALRRLPGMTPVMNVIEKVITLPDTHHAHHGMGRGAYLKGNYAVTLFLFDVLLGTAKIPRARQERFGLPVSFDWKDELFWPVLSQRRAKG